MALIWGVVPCWASILPIILRPINVDQWTSGLIGTYGQIFCAVLSFIFAMYEIELLVQYLPVYYFIREGSDNFTFFSNRIQDRFRGYMRLSIIALNLCGATAFAVFCLSANHVLPYSQSMFLQIRSVSHFRFFWAWRNEDHHQYYTRMVQCMPTSVTVRVHYIT